MADPYTTAELAHRWKCSPQHVRNLIAGGFLHCFRVGRLLRISDQEVWRFETCEDGSSSFVGRGMSSGQRQDRRGEPPFAPKIVLLPSRDTPI